MNPDFSHCGWSHIFSSSLLGMSRSGPVTRLNTIVYMPTHSIKQWKSHFLSIQAYRWRSCICVIEGNNNLNSVKMSWWISSLICFGVPRSSGATDGFWAAWGLLQHHLLCSLWWRPHSCPGLCEYQQKDSWQKLMFALGKHYVSVCLV